MIHLFVTSIIHISKKGKVQGPIRVRKTIFISLLSGCLPTEDRSVVFGWIACRCWYPLSAYGCCVHAAPVGIGA
jgi:hypothetical protein